MTNEEPPVPIMVEIGSKNYLKNLACFLHIKHNISANGRGREDINVPKQLSQCTATYEKI